MTPRELIDKLEWQMHKSLLDNEQITAIGLNGNGDNRVITMVLASGHVCRIKETTPTIADPVEPNSRIGWELTT